MAERRNNKLEVKLQLMKGKELSALNAFAKNFSDSVSRLDAAMADYTKRIEGVALNAAKGVGTQAVSANGVTTGSFTHAGYSQAATHAHAASNARGAGIAQDLTAPQAGVASTQTGPPGVSKHSTLDDEVFLSTLMANPMRAFTAQPTLSSVIKRATNLIPIGNVDPETGRATSRAGRSLQWAQQNPQAMAAGVMTLGGAYMATNFASSGYRGYAQQAGLDVGVDSPGGIMALPGLNLFTEGGRQAMKAKWSDRLASLSPTWSGQQAQELRQTMMSMGMTEDPDGIMKRMMQQGHSAATVKAFVDHARRYRPDQLPNVEGNLDRLASAASAAGMSVEEFSSATAQVAATLSRQLGIGAAEGTRITSVGAAYGLTPEQSGALMSREATFRSMGMGTAGGGDVFTRYDNASSKLTPNIESTKRLARQILPGIENYKAIAAAADKGDPEAIRQRGRIRMLASSPGVSELLGGMSPDEIGVLFDEGKVSKGRQSEWYEQELLRDKEGFLGSKSRVRDLLKSDGKLSKTDKSFLSEFSGMGAKERERKLNDIITGSGGVKDKSVKLDLTPEAKRLVKLMGGGDKESGRPRSSEEQIARTAIEVASFAVPGVGIAAGLGLKAWDAAT